MKNARIKNGFGMVSNTVIRDPDISLKEKAVYAYLATYANVHNELTVGMDRMAAECGVDQSTIGRAIKSLKDKGIISRISRGLSNTSVTILLK